MDIYCILHHSVLTLETGVWSNSMELFHIFPNSGVNPVLYQILGILYHMPDWLAGLLGYFLLKWMVSYSYNVQKHFRPREEDESPPLQQWQLLEPQMWIPPAPQKDRCDPACLNIKIWSVLNPSINISLTQRQEARNKLHKHCFHRIIQLNTSWIRLLPE